MKTLVVVAHPKLASSTTQPFFKAAVEDFTTVTWHPLHAEFDVTQEQQLLTKHDRIIFQFPLYWYGAPGLLKNWLDQVLTVRFATGNRYALADKELGLVVTAGEAAADFQAGGAEQYTMSELMRPFEALAHKLRMRYLPVMAVHQFLYLTPEAQQRLLVRYQQYVNNPSFEHFAGQVAWFSDQLRHQITKADSASAALNQVLESLENRQSELDDLAWNLSMLKKEEDS
ncbi:NAD(P)H-dependent oxidoreductase [Pediococcus acidilactici]|uniref:NAD(P)H-dependent oxidoreductase n=1 Tax=Pediococcus acidilactici TaxID=1254 RepID=UPI000FFE1D44|nr:NAD(P)H-dependent oxidoreductase [Pediococcus acidilactici]QAT20136.1 flavodoxin family protein [Pediococcus acidilactici]